MTKKADLKRLQIRRAAALEADELTRIAQASKGYWKYPESWLAAWKENLTITPDFVFWNEVFVATVDDELIGFYALVSETGRFRLEHLWIKPEFIGGGVGRALLAHAVERAGAARAGAIEIVSDPHAEKFYEKMGAERVGEEIAEIEGRPRNLPRMRIEIAPAEPENCE